VAGLLQDSYTPEQVSRGLANGMTRAMHTVDRTASRAGRQGKKDDSRADTRDSAQRWENVLLIWLEGVGGKGINFTCNILEAAK
jgi:hypothetical protein